MISRFWASLGVLAGLAGIASFTAPASAETVRLGPELHTVFDPVGLSLLDIDQSGRLSILSGGRLSSTLSLLHSMPDGSYNLEDWALFGTSPHGIAGNDLNGDGFLDLVVANNRTGDLTLFMGKGKGEYEKPRNIPLFRGFDPHGPIQSVISDLDDDGIPDIATAINTDSEVVILRGKGDGTFEDPFALPTGQAPIGIVAADFFGTGRLDLAIACHKTSAVFIHQNLGHGVFGPPIVIPTGRQPRMIATADFNQDGKPDIAVTNYGASTVSVLENQGKGKFLAHTIASSAGDIYGLDVGDIDGDGYPDVVAADPRLNRVMVMLHWGNGFDFLQQNDVPLMPFVQTVAIGDVNNDGKNDVIVGLQQESAAGFLYGVAQNPRPYISVTQPAAAPTGQRIVLRGLSFGCYQQQSRILFNGVDAGWADYWSDTMIRIKVPPGATSGQIKLVTTRGTNSPRIFRVRMRGDIDNDGQVTVEDAVMALQATVGLVKLTPEQMASADVFPLPKIRLANFGDGAVDQNDAITILKAILGQIPPSTLNP